MFESFFLLPLLAGLIISLFMSPLGCLVIWKRWAYFGDSIAHSALIGLSLGGIFYLSSDLMVICTSIIFAFILAIVHYQQKISVDSILGVMGHFALAMGAILLSIFQDKTIIDLHSYLFGNILAINTSDLYLVIGFAIISLFVIWKNWDKFILMIVEENLAAAENISVITLRGLFITVLAIGIAISIKLVGVLLANALLIIPAVIARIFVRSIKQMVIASMTISLASIFFGLLSSFWFDIPTGPSIVVSQFLMLLLALPFSRK